MIYFLSKKRSAFYGAIFGASFSYYLAAISAVVFIKLFLEINIYYYLFIGKVIEFLILPNYFIVHLVSALNFHSFIYGFFHGIAILNIPGLIFWTTIGALIGYFKTELMFKFQDRITMLYPKLKTIRVISLIVVCFFLMIVFFEVFLNLDETSNLIDAIFYHRPVYGLLLLASISSFLAIQIIFIIIDNKYLKSYKLSYGKHFGGSILGISMLVIIGFGIVAMACLHVFIFTSSNQNSELIRKSQINVFQECVNNNEFCFQKNIECYKSLIYTDF